MLMIHSNNRKVQSGFVILEVLIAIIIVGMVITPVFLLQRNVMRSLYFISARARMLFPLQNELNEQLEKAYNREEEDVTENKDMKIPAGKLTYKMRKVTQTSELKNIPDLYFTEAQMVLKAGDRESMVLFAYKPERKKKKT